MLTRYFIKTLPRRPLSWEFLRALLHYDSGSGIWARIVPTSRHQRAGERADRQKGCSGYRYVPICGRNYNAHRLAWFWTHGAWPPQAIDHKDMEKANNCLENLRLATVTQNVANRRANKNNKLGVKGVRYSEKTRLYYAQIKFGTNLIQLGSAATAVEASDLYWRAALKYYGEFARRA